VATLYDRIGSGYDATRRADPGLVALLVAQLEPGPTGRYLDLACGTGSYSVALAEQGGRWSGIDASETMLCAARARSDRIDWHRTEADTLPFPDSSFEGAVCVLAVHHFPDRQAAFREVRRVLDGGTFVIFACDVERTRRFWLREYFPHMFARIEAKEPSQAEMLGALGEAGFQSVAAESWFVPEDLTDHFLYCGKSRPALYFDPQIRAGISSFAAFSDDAEVESGLARLRADLDSGRIEDVIASSPTPAGDYVFLRASG
jgi:ubiquinone/menaquinone biosynthesis C-methylase UbiE